MLKKLLRVAFSLGLLALLLYRLDLNLLWGNLVSANWGFIGLALSLAIFGLGVSSFRWSRILRVLGFDHPPVYLARLYLAGYFYNNFLPTQMGGDVYKALKISRDTGQAGAGTFSVFMDRFSGLVALFLITLVAVYIKFGGRGLLVDGLVFIGGWFGYRLGLKLLGGRFKFVGQFREANDIFLANRRDFGVILGLSFLVQLISMAVQTSLFYAVGGSIPLWSALTFFPLISLLSLIPSINALGVQDYSYARFFGAVGIGREVAVAASVLYHLQRLVFSLIGGLLILLGKA